MNVCHACSKEGNPLALGGVTGPMGTTYWHLYRCPSRARMVLQGRMTPLAYEHEYGILSVRTKEYTYGIGS